MRERIGVPVNQAPSLRVTSVDLGDPKRPRLIRQAAELAAEASPRNG